MMEGKVNVIQEALRLDEESDFEATVAEDIIPSYEQIETKDLTRYQNTKLLNNYL